MPYVMVFFCVQLRREVVVHFVDIGGIVDNLCINFFFINVNRVLMALNLKYSTFFKIMLGDHDIN
jgi:hypothetical protein